MLAVGESEIPGRQREWLRLDNNGGVYISRVKTMGVWGTLALAWVLAAVFVGGHPCCHVAATFSKTIHLGAWYFVKTFKYLEILVL